MLSPFTDKLVDLATAAHGRTIFTYLCPDTGKEFDVLGTIPELPSSKIISDRFDAGRGFCTKLWNAARYAEMNEAAVPDGFDPAANTETVNRWIVSELAAAAGQELPLGRAYLRELGEALIRSARAHE